MKRCIFVMMVLMLALTAQAGSHGNSRNSPTHSTSEYSAQKIALVIGNASYKYPLPTPVNDARDVAAKLTELGFEAENEARKKAFAAWCVNAEMMAAAKPNALFMHCLPAHRGEEVTTDVIDGSQSVVWEEAENRMHVQKALMEYLLLGRVD